MSIINAPILRKVLKKVEKIMPGHNVIIVVADHYVSNGEKAINVKRLRALADRLEGEL